MKSLACLLATAAAIALLPASAGAQDYGAEPTYASIDLSAGFPIDPNVVPLQAGGPIDAASISDDCVGFIANAPDVRFTYESGAFPLYISTTSDADTTLVVNAPDGQWYCDDDGAGSLNPMVWFDTPQSGQYDIWVGTFTESSSEDAELYISEVADNIPTTDGEEDYHDGGEAYTGDSTIDFEAEPSYATLNLTSGFTPDPTTVQLQSGGENNAEQLGEPCVGFVASAPDVRLHYEAGSLPLYIRTRSDADTTLAVNAPDGQWYCDDDGGFDVNAQVWFETPMSGQYDIFVGTFGDETLNDATLEISEIQLAE